LDSMKTDTPKGPSPAFTPAHIVKALLVIEREQAIGRIVLSRELGIGEGSTRTVIKKLVERGLISVDSVGGCHLTDRGRVAVGALRKIIVANDYVDLAEVGISSPAYALQLRADPSSVPIIKLRDTAVKYGADGMMILTLKGGRLSMPMMDVDASEAYPGLMSALASRFRLREGDLLLIGFSESKDGAELGALSAALLIVS